MTRHHRVGNNAHENGELNKSQHTTSSAMSQNGVRKSEFLHNLPVDLSMGKVSHHASGCCRYLAHDDNEFDDENDNNVCNAVVENKQRFLAFASSPLAACTRTKDIPVP